MFYNALEQFLELQNDLLAVGNSRNEEIELMKEERSHLLEKVDAHKMKRKKIEKTFLEK